MKGAVTTRVAAVLGGHPHWNDDLGAVVTVTWFNFRCPRLYTIYDNAAVETWL